METLAIYNGLAEAHKILRQARMNSHTEPTPVWEKLSHAADYIDGQVRAMLTEN